MSLKLNCVIRQQQNEYDYSTFLWPKQSIKDWSGDILQIGQAFTCKYPFKDIKILLYRQSEAKGFVKGIFW